MGSIWFTKLTKKLLFDEISWDCYRHYFYLWCPLPARGNCNVSSAGGILCEIWSCVPTPIISLMGLSATRFPVCRAMIGVPVLECHQPRRNQDHNTDSPATISTTSTTSSHQANLQTRASSALRSSYMIWYLVLSLEVHSCSVLTDWLLDWCR